jgi:predicted transcriptional regulator
MVPPDEPFKPTSKQRLQLDIMEDRGFTQPEMAMVLHVSVATLRTYLEREREHGRWRGGEYVRTLLREIRKEDRRAGGMA